MKKRNKIVAFLLAGVIAAGSPCKVIREITEDDLLEEIQ